MNENIDLTKILKDCPQGFKLYSPLCGKVVFKCIDDSKLYSIIVTNGGNKPLSFTKEGIYNAAFTDAECILFPSAEQRNWSKFTAPWYKKEKFDPKTLKPFDMVLVRDSCSHYWKCNLFSHIETEYHHFPYTTIGGNYSYCIPYNDDTKHLVGTTEEAPEFYRYWED